MSENLTIAPDQFSIDSMPTTVEPRFFDGKDAELSQIEFENPNTGAKTFERSAVVRNFGFNGTALLTPSAFDGECGNLNLDTVDRSKLEGKILILDLEQGVQYGREEVRALLETQGIDLEDHDFVERRIVLFRTKLMAAVLDVTDEKGNPDYDKLAKVQENRPGITREGAAELHRILNPKAVMIDNISFEVNGAAGFHATQELASPNPQTGEFTPLVYHVGATDAPDFTEKNQGRKVRIEVGNPPKKQLTGYPVGVYLQ